MKHYRLSWKLIKNRNKKYSSFSLNLICNVYKNDFARARPPAVELPWTDRQVKACIKTPNGLRSYPSSHTAKGYVGGCLLQKKLNVEAADAFAAGDEEKAEKLLARGQFLYTLN